MKLTNWQKGRWAEFYARMLFRCKGYHIIAHNYKTGIGTHAGEISAVCFVRCGSIWESAYSQVVLRLPREIRSMRVPFP